MTQNFYKELTGLKLQSEKAQYISTNEYETIHRDFFDLDSYNNTISREHTLWEFYFLPSEHFDEYQCKEEQFLISVSTEKEIPCITLKKRCNIGNFVNERSSVITRSQFKDLLLENYDWMKHSSELLILEFFNKINVWRLKIGILLKCARHQIYLKKEKLMITLDNYRAVPGNYKFSHKHSIYDQMLKHSNRITVKDICSNYLGMACFDILSSIGYAPDTKQPLFIRADN